MNRVFFFLALFGSIQLQSWPRLFVKDRAAKQMQNGNWKDGKEMLQKELADNPDDIKTLQGLGTAAYKLDDFDQAYAYFDAAAEKSQFAKDKELSFFNKGNCCFQQKKLQQAIEAYDVVLEINEKHEPARHNKEVAQKMLDEQQNQNQEEQQQQNQQDQQNKDNQQKNENNNKDNDQNDQSDNQDQNNQSNSDNQSQNETSHDGKHDRSDDNQKHDDRDLNKDKQQEKEREGGSDEEQQGENDRSKKDTSDEARNDPQREDSKTDSDAKTADHGDSPGEEMEQQANGVNDRQEWEKEQGLVDNAMHERDMFKELDAHLAKLLEDQEKEDAQLSKQVIKMHVNKELAGKHGQNRW